MNTPSPGTAPKRRTRRHILWNTAGVAVALTVIVAVLVLWTNSTEFQNLVRQRLAAQVQNMVGGRVEIGAFHWKVLNLEAEAERVVIHGDEPPGEVPYATVARLDAKFSILGLMSPRVLLRDLEIEQPRIHLIVYRDGQTNQPRPSRPYLGNRSGLDTLFDLQAGHVAVTNGLFDLDDRAARLDVQNRYQPLDFCGDDVSVLMHYVPAQGSAPERFRIDAGARDVNLARGGSLTNKVAAVHGAVRATAELTRDAFLLRSLQLTAHAKDAPDRTLQLAGQWRHFAEPTWSVSVKGALDMRLLDPVLGYPFAPQGIAHLDLACAGEGGQFGIDGTVQIDKGAYIAPGVGARDVDLTARVHADPLHLRITSVIAKLNGGGEASGEVLLDHWLPPAPGQVEMHAGTTQSTAVPSLPERLISRLHRKAAPAKPSAPVAPHSELVKNPIVPIPMDGTVKAQLSNVSLDALLAIVGQPPLQRLGIATLLNGAAHAQWSNGDVNTLEVSSSLNLTPENNPPAGEAPGAGAVDATYYQRDGSVDVRTLDVRLPSSQIEAHGHLGAYPVTSASALSVDVHSQNLSEFDTVLRDLGLKRNGHVGAAALPVSLRGQADFHGTWAGSLASPILTGALHATDVSLELPELNQNGTPQLLHLDTLNANGSYDAEQIAIARAHLQRGTAQVDVSGTLVAVLPMGTALKPKMRRVPRSAEMPAFDGNSVLHVQARATQVNSKDLMSIAGVDLPVSGLLSTQVEVDGPVHAPTGSGWAQLENATVYGEPVTSVRAQGAMSGRAVHLTSFTVHAPAGTITGSGDYDAATKHVELDARGPSIDLAKIDKLQSTNVRGKLAFVLSAAGTRERPHLQAHGSITGLAVQGQTLGALQFQTQSDGQELVYDAGTNVDSAELKLHGRTEMQGNLATDARLEFSRFDVGRLLQLAHIESIQAQSSLAGAATINGPLRQVEALRGDLHLDNLAVTVAGVHLKSDGQVHATLAAGRVQLDPLHITGDGTDIRAQGTMGIEGERRLNLAAGGTVNLKLMETLDPDVTAGGTSNFKVEASGPLSDPSLTGSIEFEDGSIALEDLPNGLSQIHGTLRFNQNRLEVVSLTAMTGGGKLSLGGYLAYQRGLFADVSVTGNSIRIRYPEGVSALADAKLRLQGTPASLLLSGGVLITRFSISPNLDFAAMAAKATSLQTVAPPNTPSNHVRLDVRIQSSPQLNFQNAYAKLAGDVDLQLRGTLASPSLLGRVSITQGDAVLAGTHYELQRGDITFNNPVRIQPLIDLNATARVEDYDITLGLHGTPDKLSVTYRSDPPLPETDVVALLALGRTQSEQGLYTEQQQQSIGLSPSTDLLLGGALNATVTSRVQKLFGAGSVKVDPSYLGALGNSTTRITVEEQLGKNLTLTYATNVDTSAQQLLQAEIAVNRHVALLVTRDESGVFSMVIKATRRYR